ncbi:MAG TPA: hypothetical protein ENK11_06240 [Phycisphaerales bacterium]|nr:hypothetical protein [Phycisphaerales bacterium]
MPVVFSDPGPSPSDPGPRTRLSPPSRARPPPGPGPPWPGRFPCIAGRLLGPPRDARISDPFVSTCTGSNHRCLATRSPQRPLPPAEWCPWRRSPVAPPRPMKLSDRSLARCLP